MEVRVKVGDFLLILWLFFFPTIPRLRALGLLCVCEVQTQEVESVVISPAAYQSLRAVVEDTHVYSDLWVRVCGRTELPLEQTSSVLL